MIDKLKSIKEFKDVLKESIRVFNINHTYAFKCLTNYIDIMDKPLELWMFVPCVDGVPLDKPIKYDLWLKGFFITTILDDYYQYQKAKEKVLFKGFEIDEITTSKIYITNGNIYLSFDKETKTQISKMDMVKLCKYDIELTEAFKQLITK